MGQKAQQTGWFSGRPNSNWKFSPQNVIDHFNQFTWLTELWEMLSSWGQFISTFLGLYYLFRIVKMVLNCCIRGVGPQEGNNWNRLFRTLGLNIRHHRPPSRSPRPIRRRRQLPRPRQPEPERSYSPRRWHSDEVVYDDTKDYDRPDRAFGSIQLPTRKQKSRFWNRRKTTKKTAEEKEMTVRERQPLLNRTPTAPLLTRTAKPSV